MKKQTKMGAPISAGGAVADYCGCFPRGHMDWQFLQEVQLQIVVDAVLMATWIGWPLPTLPTRKRYLERGLKILSTLPGSCCSIIDLSPLSSHV